MNDENNPICESEINYNYYIFCKFAVLIIHVVNFIGIKMRNILKMYCNKYQMNKRNKIIESQKKSRFHNFLQANASKYDEAVDRNSSCTICLD